jgi:hypothetical protein
MILEIDIGPLLWICRNGSENGNGRLTTYYRRAASRIVSAQMLRGLLSFGGILSLPSIVQSSSDAVDGRAQGILKLCPVLALLFAAQKFDLDQTHRIHIGIAEMN